MDTREDETQSDHEDAGYIDNAAPATVAYADGPHYGVGTPVGGIDNQERAMTAAELSEHVAKQEEARATQEQHYRARRKEEFARLEAAYWRGEEEENAVMLLREIRDQMRYSSEIIYQEMIARGRSQALKAAGGEPPHKRDHTEPSRVT